MLNYFSLIHKLYNINLHGGIKLGLSNCLRLDAALGYPSKKFKSIHVAGTNGKGSVVTKIAKGFELSGKKVGLYTSPHISCFRERIRINGEMILETSVEDILGRIFHLIEIENIRATFFEITTLLAFEYFAEQKVDIAVLETGLGGRLDATNITNPLLSIITSISMDHTEILGDTIEAITKEKAGIIKSGVPVIIGPNVSKDIVAEFATALGCSLTQVKGCFSDYNAENSAIAEKALKTFGIPETIIARAILQLPPCRMETIHKKDKTVIMDVAHNPDGLLRLFATIQATYPQQKLRVVFGLSKSKDISGCLAIIQKYGAYLHIVTASNGRGLEAETLKLGCSQSHSPVVTHPTIAEAIEIALQGDELIVVCGTFFIMSEVRKALNFNEICDPVDLNEKNARISNNDSVG